MKTDRQKLYKFIKVSISYIIGMLAILFTIGLLIGIGFSQL